MLHPVKNALVIYRRVSNGNIVAVIDSFLRGLNVATFLGGQVPAGQTAAQYVIELTKFIYGKQIEEPKLVYSTGALKPRTHLVKMVPGGEEFTECWDYYAVDLSEEELGRAHYRESNCKQRIDLIDPLEFSIHARQWKARIEIGALKALETFVGSASAAG